MNRKGCIWKGTPWQKQITLKDLWDLRSCRDKHIQALFFRSMGWSSLFTLTGAVLCVFVHCKRALLLLPVHIWVFCFLFLLSYVTWGLTSSSTAANIGPQVQCYLIPCQLKPAISQGTRRDPLRSAREPGTFSAEPIWPRRREPAQPW